MPLFVVACGPHGGRKGIPRGGKGGSCGIGGRFGNGGSRGRLEEGGVEFSIGGRYLRSSGLEMDFWDSDALDS